MDIPRGLDSYHVVARETQQMMRRGQPDKQRDRATERLVMNFDPGETQTMSDVGQQDLASYSD